jgi:pyruvate formate lyase activating enzyme
MDAEEHKKWTGAGNELILENLLKISERGVQIEVRTPIIPGVNDGEKNLRETVEFLKRIETLTSVRVLAYHSYYGTKYEAIGKTASLIPDTEGNERASADSAAAFFAGEGLTVSK